MKTNLKKATLLVIATGSLFGLGACSSAEKEQETQITEQVEQQRPANSPQQILDRAAEMFANADGLTAEQKEKLSSIYTKTYVESMQIRKDLGKSKSLLFSTLSKPDYKESDITSLKKRIVELDQKRLNVMFKALDDVQAIVGRGTGTEKLYEHFKNYEMPTVNGNY